MTLIKKFDNFINEAYKGDPKKYKQWWDKGPETQIRRTFGKEYEKAIDNRVKLLLTLVDDPDKAEEYAEMDFLSLPNGISTQLVNMDPKELHTILDESVTEAKGESNEELMFNFLEALRASGATNMFGAAPYLQDSFGLSKSEAKKVLIKWMKSYESVTEARVDGKTIDGLTNKLAKIVKELKDNFLEYKKAKTDADKKKWTKRAKELTGLKQSTMDGLHKAIEAFHKDVEYDEAYESLLESTIGIKISGRAEMKYMDQIRKELDKAKIKYKFNRLSMTLSVLDMDKKDFAEAKKIVDDSELTILMAKESRVYE